MSFHVVVPARYGATRLPGKPLRLIAGEPMIVHAWRRAVESGADSVTVAADDQRICDVIQEQGGRAVMTRTDHVSGTDRLAEVVERDGLSANSVVVNLQGDEPLMDPALVATVASALARAPGADLATLATPIATGRELFDPNVVKVIIDRNGLARYFSRAPIPWVRGLFGGCSIDEPPAELPAGTPFLRHLGLYAYRVSALRALCAEPPVAVERAESLEQLRALDMGMAIHVTAIGRTPGHGVDTEADLARVEHELARRGGS